MSLDIIGPLFNIDNSNPENPVSTQIPGWHVNTNVQFPDWEQYRVTPNKPMQVLYGVQTYFYKFDSAEHFEQVLAGTE